MTQTASAPETAPKAGTELTRDTKLPGRPKKGPELTPAQKRLKDQHWRFYVAATHQEWGLRCCDRDELGNWLDAYRAEPNTGKDNRPLPAHLNAFCDDAWGPWCTQMAKLGQCVRATPQIAMDVEA